MFEQYLYYLIIIVLVLGLLKISSLFCIPLLKSFDDIVV